VQNLRSKLYRDIERYHFLLRNISNPTLIALLKEMIAEAEAQLATLDMQWRTASSSAGSVGSGHGSDAFEARLGTVTSHSRLTQVGGWQLDTQRKYATSPMGKQIRLTRGEFELLFILLMHPGEVLSREKLMALSQCRPAAPGERTIDVLINRLRQKLEINRRHPVHIKTVRNEGYVFELNETDT
jgi:DNA-binding response OmpR family regulator